MRVAIIASLVLLVSLAGCAEDPATQDEEDGFDDVDVEVDDSTGAIRGVVVDQTINPIQGASVKFTVAGEMLETLTDEQGRFAFSKVPPGNYFLLVSKLLYSEVQQGVEVKAGVEQPPIVKVQLERLVDADPYVEQLNFRGQIVCSYFAVLIRAPCITDYTTIAVNGGAANFLRDVQGDTRSFEYAIGADWKTHVVEATWTPSAQYTSEGLSVTVSYKNRTASDWYANANQADPLLLRINQGEVHPAYQGTPDRIPDEGEPEMYTFVNVGGEDLVEFSLQQDFEIFFHTSYHAPMPEGWSFIAGDPMPY